MAAKYGEDVDSGNYLATCQVITSAGLSPSFEVENGILQGMQCSPGRCLAFFDLLLTFLDKAGAKGVTVEVDGRRSTRQHLRLRMTCGWGLHRARLTAYSVVGVPIPGIIWIGTTSQEELVCPGEC